MQDGRYVLSYVATIAGTYLVIPKVDGDALAGATGFPAVVIPGPHDLEAFEVYGQGIGGTVAAGVAYYFVIEPRDAYGNFKPDDGRLSCFTGNILNPGVDPSLCPRPADRLTVDMKVRAGTVLTGYTESDLTKAELLFEPRQSTEDNLIPWKAGTYRVVFEARGQGEIVTELSMGEATLGPFNSEVTPGAVEATKITLSGIGSNGAGLGVQGAPSEPVPVYIEPRDVYGNLAPVSDPSLFQVSSVFLDDQAGVVDGMVVVSDVMFDPVRGSYYFTYTAEAAGEVLLDISYDGQPIGNGESISIRIYESVGNIDPAFTFAEGPGISGVVVGEKSSVNVVLMAESPVSARSMQAVFRSLLPLASLSPPGIPCMRMRQQRTRALLESWISCIHLLAHAQRCSFSVGAGRAAPSPK